MGNQRKQPSLFREITGLYTVFCLLFALSFLLFVRANNRMVLEETKRNARSTVQAVAGNVDELLENIERESFSAPLLMERCGTVLGKSNISTQIKALDITQAFNLEASLGGNLLWSAIVDDEGNVYSHGSKAPAPTSLRRIASSHAKQLTNPSGAIVCTEGPYKEFLFMRRIFDGNTFRFVGTFIAALSPAKLDAFFETLAQETHNAYAIKNDEQIVLYRYGVQSQGPNAFSVEAPLGHDHLTFVQYVDPNQQNTAFRRLFNLMLLFSCLLVFFTLATLLFVFKKLHRETTALQEQVERLSRGDFNPRPSSLNFYKELSVLSDGLTKSGAKIQKLMEENAAKETAREKAEYQYLSAKYGMLQAQVNPHFLYNALESINARAQLAGNYPVSDMICKLAEFYRSMFGYSGKTWLLSQEILLVQNYVSLYQSIYPNRFSVTYQVDDEAEEEIIPSLILQPLVENAIVHGIAEKIGTCSLEINCLKRDGILTLSIADDGIGMDEKRIQEVLAPSFQPRKNRMGIANVKERLALTYGKRAVLEIHSIPQKGTKVVIFIREEAE